MGKKFYSDEAMTIKKFIIILVIVIILTIGIYFFTRAFVTKDLFKKDSTDSSETAKEASIDYTKAIVGTMLNKSDAEYYVILYKSDDSAAATYANLVTTYKTKTGHLPIYIVDLSSVFNNSYYDPENVNVTTDKISDLRFGSITLLKVSDGKIKKAYTDVTKITSLLS